MIFYFSGTGNSLHVAKVIAAHQKNSLVSIPKAFRAKAFSYSLSENELLGFVFPVYAWGPPKMVMDFVSKLQLSGGKPFVFSVCTCGDEEGNTTQLLQKALSRKALPLSCAFSIKMPNNYIPGFDVDSKEAEQKKLFDAELLLTEINRSLADRQSGVFRLLPGVLPTIKTAVVNPLFNRFAMNTKKFYATGDCSRCGLCARICPVQTISLQNKPVWGRECTQCLACINRCPTRAIQYGNATVKRGRYAHPDCEKP